MAEKTVTPTDDTTREHIEALASPLAPPVVLSHIRAGYKLAIEMLATFDNATSQHQSSMGLQCGEFADDGSFAVYRRVPQHNVVGEYLAQLRELDSRDAEDAFAAILTDAIACAGSARPDADQYQELIDDPRNWHTAVPTDQQLREDEPARSVGSLSAPEAGHA